MLNAIREKIEYNVAVIEALGREFQSLWLVDAETLQIYMYREDESKSIPGSVDAATKLQNYNMARVWYIENCAVKADRERLMRLTSVESILNKISNGKPYVVEYTRANGEKLNYNQIYYSKVALDQEDGKKVTHFVMGFRDVDVRRKMEIDALTGVYTRNAFIHKATQILRENPDVEYDIVVSDIVDFKQINEKYGAKTGDKLLRAIGKGLQQYATSEVLVGRYGGDQFASLFTHEQLNRKLLEGPAKIMPEKDENLPYCEVKFGVYKNVDHERPITTLCDHAHIALNSIKDKYGEMIAIYDDTFKKTLEVQRNIERSMRQALDEEQFKVWYQPKHETVSGKLIGAEALVRWIHPEYGFMSPGDFIPLFERNGFIVEIDDYVRRRTCKNIKRWSDKNIDVVPISVNVSKLEFAKKDLVERIDSALKEASVSPDKIHIEITESLMEDDINELTRILNDLRNQGFEIELDDFGSGYSSINILSSLPLDIVKLDMSFMRQFNDPKRQKVLEACVNLGKNLGYKTVSEGVETQEQLETLRELGVDTIQGYYFSKPIPEEEFEKYMLENIG